VTPARERSCTSGAYINHSRAERSTRPVKLTEEIVESLPTAPASASGGQLGDEVASPLGVFLHRRTVERAVDGGRCGAHVARPGLLARR
jgi:hypothetical protein